MNTDKDNSQVDLRGIPCPMNLVNFKFYLHEFLQQAKASSRMEVLIQKEGAGFKNITDFLKYKGIPFETRDAKENARIIIKQQI